MAEKMDLELKALPHYHGTECYYDCWGVRVTEGVKYIMDNGYSWFVTDALAVIKTKLAGQPFLSVKLKLPTDHEADLVIEDGNYNELYRQHYDFTDARRELTLFCTDNVLMLASEY